MSSLSAAAAATATETATRFLPSVTTSASVTPLSYRFSLSLSSVRSSPLLSRLFLPQKSSPGRFSSRRIGYSTVPSPRCSASDPEQLRSAREDIKELLKTKYSHPILVRLGWHDAGTYNKNIEEWPQRGVLMEV
ncbi:UNVERIFIED_CONTAM: L-ascorbate peroxidase S, chloroplastic/mitochondrial [Sesamum angustifolium]|uniref:L-ascorbate peroxidase S, chloroplastic/mitochondrial n=1 Tax=Sesamum angustifolium TaxID=2727405 RepID=A0AAW2L5S2_9LAMI